MGIGRHRTLTGIAQDFWHGFTMTGKWCKAQFTVEFVSVATLQLVLNTVSTHCSVLLVARKTSEYGILAY